MHSFIERRSTWDQECGIGYVAKATGFQRKREEENRTWEVAATIFETDQNTSSGQLEVTIVLSTTVIYKMHPSQPYLSHTPTSSYEALEYMYQCNHALSILMANTNPQDRSFISNAVMVRNNLNNNIFDVVHYSGYTALKLSNKQFSKECFHSRDQ